jgi:hypothetical protein
MVQQTTDGGYVSIGQSGSDGANGIDAHLAKFDSAGHVLWSKFYGGDGHEWGGWVEQTPDGGYVIAGATKPLGSGDFDVYLIKTDSQGNSEWERPIGGTADDEGYTVRRTTDGGYIISGYTYPHGKGDRDVYLIKTDSQGNKEWENTFGGTGNDIGWRLEQTTDGGYIIAGAYDSPDYFHPTGDAYLVKTDSTGDLQWEMTFGIRRSGQQLTCVQQTSDGGYIAVGYTKPYAGYSPWSIYLVKLGPD